MGGCVVFGDGRVVVGGCGGGGGRVDCSGVGGYWRILGCVFRVRGVGSENVWYIVIYHSVRDKGGVCESCGCG